MHLGFAISYVLKQTAPSATCGVRNALQNGTFENKRYGYFGNE
jgi:hypothetical protein